MAVEHLHQHPKRPRNVDDVWWYEDRDGLEFYTEHRDAKGAWVRTVVFRVPWSRLRDALARFDRPRYSQTHDE